MVIYSQIRNYFTEGQIYQMWYNPESSLHTVYHLPIKARDKNTVYEPDPYLEAWDELQPFFNLFFDNDSIR